MVFQGTQRKILKLPTKAQNNIVNLCSKKNTDQWTCLFCIWLFCYHFWCHVSHSSKHAGESLKCGKFRNAVVWQFNINSVISRQRKQQNVVRLQVPIYNVVLVQISQATSDLGGYKEENMNTVNHEEHAKKKQKKTARTYFLRYKLNKFVYNERDYTAD